MIKFGELSHIVPYLPVRSVKYMRPIAMHRNAKPLFRIDISGNMIPLIYHITFFSSPCHFTGEYTAKQARPYDQIIIMHFLIFPLI